MARIVRCGLAQMGSDLPMDGAVEEIKAALTEKCVRLIEAAAAQGVRVLALPELCNTPFFASATDARWLAAAESVPAGPTIARLREVARNPRGPLTARRRCAPPGGGHLDGSFLGAHWHHAKPACRELRALLLPPTRPDSWS
jgi:hypothetical protein